MYLAMVRVLNNSGARMRGWRPLEVVLLSEKSGAHVQAIGRQKQRNDQADSAKHSNRLERLDINLSSGRAGKNSCDSSRAGASGRTSFGSHCDRPFEVDVSANA